jgi:hypothetical protein
LVAKIVVNAATLADARLRMMANLTETCQTLVAPRPS